MIRYKKISIRILQTVLILLCTQTLFAQKVDLLQLMMDLQALLTNQQK